MLADIGQETSVVCLCLLWLDVATVVNMTISILPTNKYMYFLSTGWRREIVQRMVSSTSAKDVYYHPPEGKKLRSSVEVDRYCKLLHSIVHHIVL